MKREIVLNYHVGRVPHYSGGDADVSSRARRSTEINVRVEKLRVSTDKNYVFALLTYDIRERAKDYTRLRFVEALEIPIPYQDPGEGQGKTVRIVETTDYKYQTFIRGKNHDWNQLRRPHPTSILRSGEFKFDGPGRDDQGNAQLKVSLRAWVEIT